MASTKICTVCKSKGKSKYKHLCESCYQKDRYAKSEGSFLAKRKSDPVKYLLNNLRSGAKRRGIPFSLTRQDLLDLWVDTCPVLGIPLIHHPGRQLYNSPSVDRIINAFGYQVGNVRMVSWRVNSLKSDGTIEEFEAIVSYMKGQR